MSKQQIAVIDYGMGNLHSAGKAIEHVAPNAEVVITSDIERIKDADRVVFPGVGAIGECMAEIQRLGFDTLVPELVKEKPILAICVGMQALMSHSQENGGVDCIGLIPGHVVLFDESKTDDDGSRLKVPHMGWNNVHQKSAHPMWQGIKQDSRFYFVHSYYVEADSATAVAGTTNYGVELVSAMSIPNLFSVQFHPEKSHDSGLQLLRNFVSWDGVE